MKYVVVFQGQGRYSTKLAREIYNQEKIVRDFFKEADEVLDFSVSNLFLETDDIGYLDTDKAQVLIYVMEYAIYKCKEKNFIKRPEALAGHSLGEITALTASGAISFFDGLLFVQNRGRLMKEKRTDVKQGMLAVRNIPIEKVIEVCKTEKKTGECIVCANYNSNTEVVLSGHTSALERIEKALGNKNSKFLKVNTAFHSPLMEDVAVDLEKYIDQIQYYPMQIPVISSVNGKKYLASWVIPQILKKQICSPVLWKNVMRTLSRNGVEYYAQVLDSNLFSHFDEDNNYGHLWFSLCDDYNAILDFGKLYNENSKSILDFPGIVAEALGYAISFPWKEDLDTGIFIQLEDDYNYLKSMYNAIEEGTEVKEWQANKALKILDEILEHKNLKSLHKEEIMEKIKSKYFL